MIDLYPSRKTKFEFTDRVDSVIHGRSGFLKEHQRQQYINRGFLVLHNVLTKAELNEIRSNPQSIIICEPESSVVRSVFGVRDIPNFTILQAIEEIVGGDMYIHQSRINYKRGLGSTGWMWHSDFETWHTEDGMPRMRAATVMIPLTNNTHENGPLLVIPGSHKWFLSCPGKTPENHYEKSLRNQEVGVPDKKSLIWFFEKCSGIRSIICEPGDVVIFDCNLMHASNSNVTPFDRTNAFFVYNSVDNKLVDPYCGEAPRPEHVGARLHTESLGEKLYQYRTGYLPGEGML